MDSAGAVVGGTGLELGRKVPWCGATSRTTASCAGSRTTASVSVFRTPSNNSNGNTFDFQGRQLSCEHLTRRVVRYEHDGSVDRASPTRYNGKRLNSPNDVVPHPDGSYWFTDPPYGGQLYEGAPDAAGGPSNRARAGSSRASASRRRSAPASASCRPTAIASIPAGASTSCVSEDQVPDPNGLCFSPDYKKLYVVSTGKGPGDTGPGGKGDMYVFDVGTDNKLANRQAVQRLHDRRRQVRPGRRALPTSTAISGCSSNAGRAVGYSGVTVWTPGGQAASAASACPRVCGNVCFGGPKRNRLFMAASQSLYAPLTSPRRGGPAWTRYRREPVTSRRAPESRNQLWAWTKVLILRATARAAWCRGGPDHRRVVDRLGVGQRRQRVLLRLDRRCSASRARACRSPGSCSPAPVDADRRHLVRGEEAVHGVDRVGA